MKLPFSLKKPKFWGVKLAQLLCTLYIIILTFSYYPLGLRDPATGKIIDPNSEANTENGVIFINGAYRPVVAANTWQMLCLAVSRISAFSLYPLLVMVFVSKCRGTLTYFVKTPYSLLFPEFFTDSHSFHIYAGRYIAFDAWLHTIFHLLRWMNQRNMYLLWKHSTGLSGLIVFLVTPLITFIMMYLKKHLKYEVRKAFHYLYIVFGIGLCFHVPISGVPNGGFIAPIMGFVITWYLLDSFYVNTFMTEKISTPVFEVLDSGVQVTMTVSESFRKKIEQGGYVYICLPWINLEWHAFSLFEVADDSTQRQIFIQNVGNWTGELYEALQRNTHRPLWIQGPFPSSFNNVMDYDNQILVATGIGITPVIAAAKACMNTRRVNILWIVRDPDVLEFFLEFLSLNTDGWLIAFYTGKKPLSPYLEEYWSHTNVRIIKGRPNIKALIPSLIYGIESKKGLPEQCLNEKKEKAIQTIIRMFNDSKAEGLDENAVLEEAYNMARKRGFQLSTLLQEMEKKKLPRGSVTYDRMSDMVKRSFGIRGTSVRGSMDTISDHLGLLESAQGLESDKKGEKVKPDTRDDSGKSVQFSNGDAKEFTEKIENGMTVEKKVGLSNAQTSIWIRGPSVRSFRRSSSFYGPWVTNDNTHDYVKSLDKKALETWGILYCGKNRIISSLLKEVSKEYDIDLIKDFFDW